MDHRDGATKLIGYPFDTLIYVLYERDTEIKDELAEHVNTEHPGEFRRLDWLATEAGSKARTRD